MREPTVFRSGKGSTVSHTAISRKVVGENVRANLGGKKKRNKRQIYGLLFKQETSAVEQNSSSRDGKKEDGTEQVTEVSKKLCLVFVCRDVILWSLSMKDIN